MGSTAKGQPPGAIHLVHRESCRLGQLPTVPDTEIDEETNFELWRCLVFSSSAGPTTQRADE